MNVVEYIHSTRMSMMKRFILIVILLFAESMFLFGHVRAQECSGPAGIDCVSFGTICPQIPGCTLSGDGDCLGSFNCSDIHDPGVCILAGCSASASPGGGGAVGGGCCFGSVEQCNGYLTRELCEEDSRCQWNPLCDPASALEELVKLLMLLLHYVPFGGILLGVIILILGGFLYITCPPGDYKKMQQARYTVAYAIIGIVLSSSLYLVIKILTAIIPGLSEYVNVG